MCTLVPHIYTARKGTFVGLKSLDTFATTLANSVNAVRKANITKYNGIKAMDRGSRSDNSLVLIRQLRLLKPYDVRLGGIHTVSGPTVSLCFHH